MVGYFYAAMAVGMKLIIAGSREVRINVDDIEAAIKKYRLEPTEIVTGCARGPDTVAILYAEKHKIPVRRFPAEWEKFKDKNGKNPAGIIRNRLMGNYADVLLAFWDGKSRGTYDMCKYMGHLGKTKYMIMHAVYARPKKPIMCDMDDRVECAGPKYACCRDDVRPPYSTRSDL